MISTANLRLRYNDPSISIARLCQSLFEGVNAKGPEVYPTEDQEETQGAVGLDADAIVKWTAKKKASGKAKVDIRLVIDKEQAQKDLLQELTSM